MSRKDYIEFARLLHSQSSILSIAAQSRLAHGMADIFAADNPAFDYKRFLDACGLKDHSRF